MCNGSSLGDRCLKASICCCLILCQPLDGISHTYASPTNPSWPYIMYGGGVKEHRHGCISVTDVQAAVQQVPLLKIPHCRYLASVPTSAKPFLCPQNLAWPCAGAGTVTSLGRERGHSPLARKVGRGLEPRC